MRMFPSSQGKNKIKMTKQEEEKNGENPIYSGCCFPAIHSITIVLVSGRPVLCYLDHKSNVRTRREKEPDEQRVREREKEIDEVF